MADDRQKHLLRRHYSASSASDSARNKIVIATIVVVSFSLLLAFSLFLFFRFCYLPLARRHRLMLMKNNHRAGSTSPSAASSTAAQITESSRRSEDVLLGMAEIQRSEAAVDDHDHAGTRRGSTSGSLGKSSSFRSPRAAMPRTSSMLSMRGENKAEAV